MAGVEGGRESGISLDLYEARVYKYAFMFSQVPFVNFFPALEPHPLPCNCDRGPFLPQPWFAHSKARPEGTCGGLRGSAEPSGSRASDCPARKLEPREVRNLKRPLPPGARLCARRSSPPGLCTHLLLLGAGGRKVLRLSHLRLWGGGTGFVLCG